VELDRLIEDACEALLGIKYFEAQDSATARSDMDLRHLKELGTKDDGLAEKLRTETSGVTK